jgi:hypothetical protein
MKQFNPCPGFPWSFRIEGVEDLGRLARPLARFCFRLGLRNSIRDT